MRFETEHFLAGLKPFQRETVEYVFGRFFDPSDPVDRFLIADEVGLGKTMVAKGMIELHLGEPSAASTSSTSARTRRSHSRALRSWPSSVVSAKRSRTA